MALTEEEKKKKYGYGVQATTGQLVKTEPPEVETRPEPGQRNIMAESLSKNLKSLFNKFKYDGDIPQGAEELGGVDESLPDTGGRNIGISPDLGPSTANAAEADPTQAAGDEPVEIAPEEAAASVPAQEFTESGAPISTDPETGDTTYGVPGNRITVHGGRKAGRGYGVGPVGTTTDPESGLAISGVTEKAGRDFMSREYAPPQRRPAGAGIGLGGSATSRQLQKVMDTPTDTIGGLFARKGERATLKDVVAADQAQAGTEQGDARLALDKLRAEAQGENIQSQIGSRAAADELAQAEREDVLQLRSLKEQFAGETDPAKKEELGNRLAGFVNEKSDGSEEWLLRDIITGYNQDTNEARKSTVRFNKKSGKLEAVELPGTPAARTQQQAIEAFNNNPKNREKIIQILKDKGVDIPPELQG